MAAIDALVGTASTQAEATKQNFSKNLSVQLRSSTDYNLLEQVRLRRPFCLLLALRGVACVRLVCFEGDVLLFIRGALFCYSLLLRYNFIVRSLHERILLSY